MFILYFTIFSSTASTFGRFWPLTLIGLLGRSTLSKISSLAKLFWTENLNYLRFWCKFVLGGFFVHFRLEHFVNSLSFRWFFFLSRFSFLHIFLFSCFTLLSANILCCMFPFFQKNRVKLITFANIEACNPLIGHGMLNSTIFKGRNWTRKNLRCAENKSGSSLKESSPSKWLRTQLHNWLMRNLWRWYPICRPFQAMLCTIAAPTVLTHTFIWQVGFLFLQTSNWKLTEWMIMISGSNLTLPPFSYLGRAGDCFVWKLSPHLVRFITVTLEVINSIFVFFVL